MTENAFPIDFVRRQFPALDSGVVYFDNPAGTQVCRACMDRMTAYMVQANANSGGVFETSIRSEACCEAARDAMAAFLNAPDPASVIFGANMTTLTQSLSHALARRFTSQDTVVVTRLDHDANISPWLHLARDTGCRVRWVDFNHDDGCLDMDGMASAMAEGPTLVAVGLASNALGTINPVQTICRMARDAGAMTFVDAVHYAPHGPMDVRALGCDFLACSAYKFFGPHVGVLWGREEALDSLDAYKVRPAPDALPGKFETGTRNYEGIAGLLGTLEYFMQLGTQCVAAVDGASSPRRKLEAAMSAIQAYEQRLSARLLDGLQSIRGLHLYGITDPARLHERAATYAFRREGASPQAIAEWLARHGINTWNGHYYAIEVVEALGFSDSGGLLRVGPVHYNTLEEVDRFIEVLTRQPV